MESSVEGYGKFFLMVILALIAYNMLVKPVVPTTVQSWIGI
jgi:hypothetical protein